MSQSGEQIEEIKEQFDETAERVARNPWVERLARFGFAAKGVVYITAGALAVLAALGQGGEVTDARGSMRSLARLPYGRPLLGVVAFGLVAYVLWRWVQSVTDADGKGRSWKGLAIRAGYFGSGTVYAGLSLTAARILFGAYDEGQPSAAQSWTARLLSVPFGRWGVVLAGLGVLGFGGYQIYKGWSLKFRKRLKLSTMGEAASGWATFSGRVGYIARGVVFIIIGLLLERAALTFDSSQAGGIDSALQTLARSSLGMPALLAVAAGLVAYGCYALVEARYRRIAGS
jgi:hypothetical protein